MGSCRNADPADHFLFPSRYKHKVYRIAYRFTDNAEDAEDLSREAFLKLYRAIGIVIGFNGAALSQEETGGVTPDASNSAAETYIVDKNNEGKVDRREDRRDRREGVRDHRKDRQHRRKGMRDHREERRSRFGDAFQGAHGNRGRSKGQGWTANNRYQH